MSHYRKFVKNVGIIGITQFITNFKGVLLLPILAKTLGAEQYGIWAQITVTLSFLASFTNLGIPSATMRFLPTAKTNEEIKHQIWSTSFFIAAINIVAGLGLILFSAFIENVLHIPAHFIPLVACILFLNSLNTVFLGSFQALQEIKKLSFFTLSLAIGDVFLTATAVLLGYGLLGAILSFLIIRVLISFALLGVFLKKIGILMPNFSRIKEYLHFGVPTIAEGIAFRLVQVGDQYIIGGFLGIIFVGYYSPAYSLALIPNMITLPIGMILPAVLSKFFSENNIAEVKTYLTHTLKYTLLFVIPAAFGLSVLSKQLLTIFATQEIAEQAYLVVPFVALSFILFAAQGSFIDILYLFKKTRLMGGIWLFAAILNIGTNLLFIPKFGILGAAFTTLLAYLFVLFATWFVASKYLAFVIDWKSIFKSVGASSLMALLIFMFHPEGLLKTIAAIAFGALFYLLFLLLIRGIGKKEIEFLRQLWKKYE